MFSNNQIQNKSSAIYNVWLFNEFINIFKRFNWQYVFFLFFIFPIKIPEPLKQAILSSTDLGERFVSVFFKALDNYRENLGNYILPDAAIVWQGNPIAGRDNFLAMYNNMPPETRHDVTSFDVHPLGAPATPEGMGQQVIVNASGKVKIGSELREKSLWIFSSVYTKAKSHRCQ